MRIRQIALAVVVTMLVAMALNPGPRATAGSHRGVPPTAGGAAIGCEAHLEAAFDMVSPAVDLTFVPGNGVATSPALESDRPGGTSVRVHPVERSAWSGWELAVAPTDTLRFGVAVYVAEPPTAETELIGLWDSDVGTRKAYLTIDARGSLQLYDAVGNSVVASALLPVRTWARVVLVATPGELPMARAPLDATKGPIALAPPELRVVPLSRPWERGEGRVTATASNDVSLPHLDHGERSPSSDQGNQRLGLEIDGVAAGDLVPATISGFDAVYVGTPAGAGTYDIYFDTMTVERPPEPPDRPVRHLTSLVAAPPGTPLEVRFADAIAAAPPGREVVPGGRSESHLRGENRSREREPAGSLGLALSECLPVEVEVTPRAAHTTDRLRLRAGPGTEHDTITVMPAGTAISIVGDARAGFYPVDFGSATGWASADYLAVGDRAGDVANPGRFGWPLVGPVTSVFGPAHPLGIDIGANRADGVPVAASAAGTVTFVGGKVCCSYGLYIRIDHEHGMSTLYAHLSAFRVAVGQWVGAGEVIGLSGNTGRSTGPHLHFEIRQNGAPLDPLTLLP